MTPPARWLLNLAADEELATGGPPPRRVEERLAAAKAAFVAALPAGHHVLAEAPRGSRGAPTFGRGTPTCGRPWCPTPSAVARLREAGVPVRRFPPLDVLRRVNARPFAFALGLAVPGARLATTLAEVRAASPASDPVRLSGAFTVAGRGHRVLRGRWTPADEAWARRQLGRGPIVVAPQLEVVTELALHGRLTAAGLAQVGRPVLQRTDRRGAWRGSAAARRVDVDPALTRAMETALERAAGRLRAAGYTGPFGIDGLLGRGRGARLEIAPLNELNARYTMGWPVAFGWVDSLAPAWDGAR